MSFSAAYDQGVRVQDSAAAICRNQHHDIGTRSIHSTRINRRPQPHRAKPALATIEVIIVMIQPPLRGTSPRQKLKASIWDQSFVTSRGRRHAAVRPPSLRVGCFANRHFTMVTGARCRLSAHMRAAQMLIVYDSYRDK